MCRFVKKLVTAVRTAHHEFLCRGIIKTGITETSFVIAIAGDGGCLFREDCMVPELPQVDIRLKMAGEVCG